MQSSDHSWFWTLVWTFVVAQERDCGTSYSRCLVHWYLTTVCCNKHCVSWRIWLRCNGVWLFMVTDNQFFTLTTSWLPRNVMITYWWCKPHIPRETRRKQDIVGRAFTSCNEFKTDSIGVIYTCSKLLYHCMQCIVATEDLDESHTVQS